MYVMKQMFSGFEGMLDAYGTFCLATARGTYQ